MCKKDLYVFLCFRLKTPYRTENYLNQCKKFHVQSLINRRRLADCTFLLKILSNEIDCPDLLAKLHFSVPQRSIRFNPPISIPSSSSKYRQNSCIVRVSRDFNRLCKEFSFDPYTTTSFTARNRLNLDFFH